MLKRWILVLCLVFGGTASATDFTVGTSGTYRSLQEGIDAALAQNGEHRVLVQRGTYWENVFLSNRFLPQQSLQTRFKNPCFRGTLEVIGGYGNDFSDENRSTDPSQTILATPGEGTYVFYNPINRRLSNSLILHALTVDVSGVCQVGDQLNSVQAWFTIKGLELTGSSGALSVYAEKGAKVFFKENLITRAGRVDYHFNMIELITLDQGPSSTLASDIARWTQASIDFAGNNIVRNSVGQSGRIFASYPYNAIYGLTTVRNNVFEGNSGEEGRCIPIIDYRPGAVGGIFSGNIVRNNNDSGKGLCPNEDIIETSFTNLGASREFFLFPANHVTFLIENNIFSGNRTHAHAFAYNFSYPSSHNQTAIIRNNLMMNAGGTAVRFYLNDTHMRRSELSRGLPISRTLFANNTIVGSEIGVSADSACSNIEIPPDEEPGFPPCYFSIVNNIFWNNQYDFYDGSGTLVGPLSLPRFSTIGFNNSDSSGRDPLFVDAANGDYRLSPTSPFINFGVETDYGPEDLLHNARVQGGRVDLGAIESQ